MLKKLGIVSLVLASGCASAPAYKQPCVIEGVTIRLMDDDAVDRYCQAVVVPVDETGNSEASDPIWGCARGKEIVIPDRKDIMLHELRHLLEFNCKQKGGAVGR